MWTGRVAMRRHPIFIQHLAHRPVCARNAQGRLACLVLEVSSGTVRPAGVTVSVSLERWLELVGDELSPTTLRACGRLIARRIAPALGALNLSTVAADHSELGVD